MSFLGDVLGFENFNAKDMFGKLKSHPQRALIGAIDPASTKMWNSILGTNYEPMTDQMGGAYGGHNFSAFGQKDGGVYGRAKAAGINTGPGGNIQDLVHVIAAAKLLGAGMGAGGSGGAGAGEGAGSEGGFFSSMFGGGGESTSAGAGGSSASQWMSMIPQGGGMGQQQQQPPPDLNRNWMDGPMATQTVQPQQNPLYTALLQRVNGANNG